MKPFRKIIQLELNELSIDIIRALCAAGELPNFNHLLTNWHHRTTTSEDKYELIEPWIQWVTAHTGKAFADHQVFRLGDLTNLRYPQTWEILSNQGLRCCVIGSMNARRGSMSKGFFLPDPWGSEEDVYPTHLKALWKFIRSNVQEHNQKLTVLRYAKALESIVRQQLPLPFLLKLAYHVIAKKMKIEPGWKLASLFDEFLFALFKKQLKKDHSYYTLFLNSIAHYQHHYWRNHHPGIFSNQIQSPAISNNDDPVRYGYRVYDRLLGEVVQLADQDTLVIVISGLSQVPYVAKEEQGGLCYYRLLNHTAFLDATEINYQAVKPLMSRDWLVYFENEADAEHCSSILENLTVDDEPLLNVNRHASNAIFVETRFAAPVDQEACIRDPIRGITIKFGDYFMLTAIKSGHHHGEGLFFSSAEVFPNEKSTHVPLSRVHDLTVDNFLKKAVSSEKPLTLEES